MTRLRPMVALGTLWLLALVSACSGSGGNSGDEGVPEVAAEDIPEVTFAFDISGPEFPWEADSSGKSDHNSPDLQEDIGGKDAAADNEAPPDAEPDVPKPDVVSGPCVLNPQCEKNTVLTEVCGRCGTRSRPCTELCQFGEWSECLGQGPCAYGDKEEEPCGIAGTRYRECSQQCTWGLFGECQNEAACSPGDSQTEACGLCGQRTRGCSSAYAWNPWSECTGQGACAPGNQETQSCGNCGTQTRTCGEDCQWGQPEACSQEGECSPNQQQSQPCGNCGQRLRTCTAACTWPDWGQCLLEGECVPLETETLACGKCGFSVRKCTGECVWGETGACQGEGECLAGQTEVCDNCGLRQCDAQCAWGSCDIGYVDVFEPNNTQATAHNMGTMADDEQSQVVGGNINPSFDADWYKITITDTQNQAINPRFTLRNVPPGQTYRLYVLYDCAKSDLQYSDELLVTASGTISLNVDGCFDVFILSDDSGTAYIKVEPITSGSCSLYELEVKA